MVDRFSFGGHRRTIRCAVCRQVAAINDISYVCTKQSRVEEIGSGLRVLVCKHDSHSKSNRSQGNLWSVPFCVSGMRDRQKFHLFLGQGDHSTKVEGVVRCLMKIQQEDPTAKSLVFSTVWQAEPLLILVLLFFISSPSSRKHETERSFFQWWDVLNILEKALKDNNIELRSLGASHKFQVCCTCTFLNLSEIHSLRC